VASIKCNFADSRKDVASPLLDEPWPLTETGKAATDITNTSREVNATVTAITICGFLVMLDASTGGIYI